MKKQIAYFLFLQSIIVPTAKLFAPASTINTSGSYTIRGDISYSPISANDSVILITANNVVLDLGGRNLIQGNTTAGLNGIVVGQNLNNVTIKNGCIWNITGTGIGIGLGCTNVIIDSIITQSCDLRGISFNGVSTAPIQDSSLQNCTVNKCCQGALGDYALSFTQCNRVDVTNIKINSNGLSSHTLSALRMNNCSQSIINAIQINNNIGSTLVRAVDLSTVQYCQFSSILAQSNSCVSSSSITVGFELASAASSSLANTNNKFKNCAVASNIITAATSTFTGITIGSNNNDNYFVECQVNQNSSTNPMAGFTSTSASRNHFTNCVAQNNDSSGSAALGNTTGFNFISCTGCEFLNCNAADQSGTTVSGFLFTSCTDCLSANSIAENNIGTTQSTGFRITSCTSCAFKDNLATRNRVTGSDAASFGFVLSSDTDSTYITNVALRNGATAGNQFNGFPSDAVTNVNGTNVNTLGLSLPSPWTNFGLTG